MAQSAVRFDQVRKNFGHRAVLQDYARDSMEQSFLKCIESGADA